MARIDGDDGLPADDVGAWAKEKHSYLTRYIDISKAARKKYIGPGKGGAAYFDLFCGAGRSHIRDTAEWIDGSAVAAWKASVTGGAPFSEVYISDTDLDSLNACAARLRGLGAPVTPIHASAVDAVEKMVAAVKGFGLYLAFIDPYNLGTLDFRIIECLARLKRMDLLIHVSAMDLQRNLDSNVAAEESAFDIFAPKWREKIDLNRGQHEIRLQVFHYWRDLVADLGAGPSTEIKLLRGNRRQPLYWLLLAAKHDLAHKFWATAVNPEGQGKWDF